MHFASLPLRDESSSPPGHGTVMTQALPCAGETLLFRMGFIDWTHKTRQDITWTRNALVA